MYGRTNAGGGVSAKGFIQTTYPEGFICTCSNGTRTLKARDTSGYMMFILPAIGKWTVTATDPADPTNTDSQTVEITTEGEIVSVVLKYRIYLYRAGDQCIDITGGWGATASLTGTSAWTYAKLAVNTTEMSGSVPGNSSTVGILYSCTQAPVDFQRKTLKVQYRTDYNSVVPGVSVRLINALNNGSEISTVTDKESPSGEDNILSLDCSAITQNLYIFVDATQLRANASITFAVKNIWLE